MRGNVKSILACSLALVCGLTGCGTGGTTALTVLDESVQPLRDRFNADKERIRVVGLFSPV